jgi:hypothetical protein
MRKVLLILIFSSLGIVIYARGFEFKEQSEEAMLYEYGQPQLFYSSKAQNSVNPMTVRQNGEKIQTISQALIQLTLP